MKRIHLPQIDARYWCAILFASIFGTNLGDLYAHDSGLGIWPGVALLAAIAGIVFLIERADNLVHEAYYWLAIVIIRTGATNIADYWKHIIDPALLLAGLAAVLAAVAWLSTRPRARAATPAEKRLPAADAIYWVGMLDAGVFGTLGGDIGSHLIGKGSASLVLGALLLAALAWRHRRAAASIGAYWAVVAIARSAGTSIGDFLAETPSLNVGLPLSTAITGCIFAAIVFGWRSRRLGEPAAAVA